LLRKHQSPFEIRGFHSDNGRGYINHTLARRLNKLLIEQTKSRPRRSYNNGWVETKNGWVIHKHLRYGQFAAAHSKAISRRYRQHLNLYVNLPRRCAQADVETDEKADDEAIIGALKHCWKRCWRCPMQSNSCGLGSPCRLARTGCAPERDQRRTSKAGSETGAIRSLSKKRMRVVEMTGGWKARPGFCG
jgi:hypothetical protein